MLSMVQHAEKLADERYALLFADMEKLGPWEVTVWREYVYSVEADMGIQFRSLLSTSDMITAPQLIAHVDAFDARFSNHVATTGWPVGKPEGE